MCVIGKYKHRKCSNLINDTYAAVFSGEIERVQTLIEQNKLCYAYALRVAAANHKTEIVRLMLKLGAEDDMAPCWAAYYGYAEIALQFLEIGANIDDMLVSAIRGGLLESVEMFLALGAEQYNEALKVAATSGFIDIIQRIIEAGADNFGEAIQCAYSNGNSYAANYLIAWKKPKLL